MRIAPQTETRLRLLSTRIHALGPRPLFEFFKEIAQGADLIERAERYAMLSPDVVAALGADRFPPRARVIGGAR